MGTRSKDTIKTMIANDVMAIFNRYSEVKKSIQENLEDTLDYFNTLIAQIPQSASGPLIAKTPKVLRKRGKPRVKTIPEDEIVDTDCTMSDSIAITIKTEKSDDTLVGRSQRQASKKAADNIRKQQSLTLATKLRRTETNEVEEIPASKKKRVSHTKRKKSARSSSDEDENRGPLKHSKIEDDASRESTSSKPPHLEPQDHFSADETVQLEDRKSTLVPVRHSNRKRSSTQSIKASNKKNNIIDDTVIAPVANDEEPSLYEDAIEKPTPIMNSTMNVNSTMVLHKIMNSTVVLEPLALNKLNETVTIKKKSIQVNGVGSNGEQRKKSTKEAETKSPRLSKTTSPSKKALQDRMQQLKEAMADKEFDQLITDDESSPEQKKARLTVKKQEERKRQKRAMYSSSSDDEVLNTPAKTALREVNAGTVGQETRNMQRHKANALFSPYAKESVKKRVEAFEQAGMNSPKPATPADVPTRVTRTKTRAIAAAKNEASENAKVGEKMVAQKLARKSLARAKKISLAKQVKDVDEYKENKVQSAQKISKLVPMDKPNQKQQKTTPLGKSKILLPMSVSRIPQTPNNQYANHYPKAFSATRGNIVTSLDSFIQQPRTASKPTSAEKLEDKRKRVASDEDAKRKREEALRLQMEEKRRKREEKELKNKLAREAKEKQDMEKRQKAEREREEKARLAQQMQDKQREEMERKRHAQLQRAQEKEERRRLEEQLRLQRLQEQEEAERLLAEQRRREQEAEKRKEAEARAQQQAAVEAMKIKNQMLAAQAKQMHAKHHGPTNYILDSEPDEDGESDDEYRPKHPIPYWAQPQVRKAQLAIQRFIPERAVFKFFDARKCTPDLTELFQGIDRSRLKRTSSAIWKTPPRYSMMEIE